MTNKNNGDKNKSNRSSYLVIGILFGTTLGIIFKNLPIGLGLGAAFGILMGGANFDK